MVQKKTLDPPRTGVIDGGELSCGSWGSNPGPLGEQSTFIIS